MTSRADEVTVDEMNVVAYIEPRGNQGRPKSKRGWAEDKKRFQYDMPEALLERFAAFLSDEDYLSLAKEIALLRTFLNGMLATMKYWQDQVNAALEAGEDVGSLPKPPISYSQLLAAIDNVGKMVEREARILNSDANTITLESAMTFAIAVADTVNRYVKEPRVQEAIYTEIRRLLTAGKTFNISLEVARRILNPTIPPDDVDNTEEETESAGH